MKLKISAEERAIRLAGLRYGNIKGPGLARRRAGKSFAYLDVGGKSIRDEEILARIRSIVIPPAWTEVWISPAANSHIQAIGWDARGRKQYRYHVDYRLLRDAVKFNRMREFGKVLPRIRRAVNRDLGLPGMPRRKVLAALVKLLETTYIRIGNEEYAKENDSFGLTTLENRHVHVLGQVMSFKFRGKSGQDHEISLEDARLAKVIRKCKCLPGRALFQYIDEEGNPAAVESGDVNDYLREISDGEFTAKDFRTWGGTCLAVGSLLKQEAATTQKELKSILVEIVKSVALKLGNKPATCKKYYIHPLILNNYSDGSLATVAAKFVTGTGSYRYEQLVLAILSKGARPAKAA